MGFCDNSEYFQSRKAGKTLNNYYLALFLKDMLNFTLYHKWSIFTLGRFCCSFMRIQRLGGTKKFFIPKANLASRHKLPGWNVNSVTNICLKNISLKTSFLIKAVIFSSSHVWMWELDYKESWVPKNWCF